MGRVNSASGMPAESAFSGYRGTPIYINTAIGHGYILRDDGVIVDLSTGESIGAGFWDDLRFPASLQRQGATTKPDFDYANIGLLFPQNDPTEISYMIGQIPHSAANIQSSRNTTTTLRPHVHFVQTSSSVPVFKLAYKWYNNGDAVPAGYTTISTTSLVFTYSSGSLSQIAVFPEIANSGQKVSSIIDMKLYRDDNAVAGDVLVKEFDIHYQSFSFGTTSTGQ